MGSTFNDLDQEDFTVLVTGFGPFKELYPQNPSWEIASRLPDYLPPVRPKTSGADQAPLLPPVRILTYPEAVRVNYTVVRELVPKLWHLDGGDDGDDGDDGKSKSADSGAKGRRIDLALHIGMAGPQLRWCIERRGHRDGYWMKDVDGKYLGDELRRVMEGKDWIWYGVPKELETDLDIDDVLKRWKAHSPGDLDLEISEDAGRYLCDFIYFSSLAHLHKAGEPRRVLFLHVPADASDERVATGKELVLQLIRSIVESEFQKKTP